MASDLINEALSTLSWNRITIYLNQGRVKRNYDQIGGIDEFSASSERNIEMDAGLPSWMAVVVGKLLQKRGRGEKKQISDSPELMAAALEAHYELSGELLKLTDESSRERFRFIRYVGPAFVSRTGKPVTKETTGLSDAQVEAVQAQRGEQEEILKKTVVFTVPGEPSLASIAHWESVKPYESDFASYAAAPFGSKGILARYEREEGGVVFLSPLWIWHED